MDVSIQHQVEQLIAEHSRKQGKMWMLYSPVTVPNSQTLDIIIVNQFLRVQLGLLEVDKGVDTSNARECLVDGEIPKEWIKNFKDAVAPVIARYGLPVWGF